MRLLMNIFTLLVLASCIDGTNGKDEIETDPDGVQDTDTDSDSDSDSDADGDCSSNFACTLSCTPGRVACALNLGCYTQACDGDGCTGGCIGTCTGFDPNGNCT